MRSISMKKAPDSQRRPSRDGACGVLGSSSDSVAGELKVLVAAAIALAASPPDPPLDFTEELPGDVGFRAGGREEGDGDAMGDRLLEASEVGNDRFKRQCTKVLAKFHKITLLHRASPPKSRCEVPQQPQSRVVTPLNVSYPHRLADGSSWRN